MKYVLALMLATGFLAAQEEVVPCEIIPQEVNQDFGYISLGLGPFPVPVPTFTGGFRYQAGHHGFDTSLQVATLIELTQLKANLLYHYYPKPCLRSQAYYGVGVGPSVVFGRHDKTGFLISPEFVFGKQYQNESDDIRFFQAQVSFPTFGHAEAFGSRHHHGFRHLTWFPLVIISYGWGF